MTDSSRSQYTLAFLILLLAAPAAVHVNAQFGLSVPCNNCLVTQISTLPACVGVNLTNPAQQSTPQYRTCLCDSSFDFNWTTPCTTSCQTNELSNFESNFPNLLKTGLNLTCIKPTPSPTATPTHNAGARVAGRGGIDAKVLLGWGVVVVSSAVLTFLSSV